MSILAGSGIGAYIDSVNADLKGPSFHFEEVELQENPAYGMVMNPTAMNGPWNENCGGGVTNRGDRAMEETPANQSVAVACTAKAEEPAYP